MAAIYERKMYIIHLKIYLPGPIVNLNHPGTHSNTQTDELYIIINKEKDIKIHCVFENITKY